LQVHNGWGYEQLCENNTALIGKLKEYIDWPKLREGRIEALDSWEKGDDELDELLEKPPSGFDLCSWSWEDAQPPTRWSSNGA
jgi:hypothetical protein